MLRKTAKQAFLETRDYFWRRKLQSFRPHRSFRRSYREDYCRPIILPGLATHAFNTLRILFKNWRLFGLLLSFFVFVNLILVGVMSEEIYIKFQDILERTNIELAGGQLGNFARSGLLILATLSTGGLAQGMTESQQILTTLIFLILWLNTAFFLRHLLAGHKPKFRDGLYNSLTPLLSTFFILVLVFIQSIPIFIVTITYSAAVLTEFLSTPFYALIYFIFASLLTTFSLYLLSGSFVALAAVSAPGLYPMAAIRASSDLILGHRLKILIRLVFMLFTIALIWVLVLLPIILIDLKLKSEINWLAGLPIVPFSLMTMTFFSFIYASAYSYLLYRTLLDQHHEV